MSSEGQYSLPEAEALSKTSFKDCFEYQQRLLKKIGELAKNHKCFNQDPKISPYSSLESVVSLLVCNKVLSSIVESRIEAKAREVQKSKEKAEISRQRLLPLGFIKKLVNLKNRLLNEESLEITNRAMQLGVDSNSDLNAELEKELASRKQMISDIAALKLKKAEKQKILSEQNALLASIKAKTDLIISKIDDVSVELGIDNLKIDIKSEIFSSMPEKFADFCQTLIKYINFSSRNIELFFKEISQNDIVISNIDKVLAFDELEKHGLVFINNTFPIYIEFTDKMKLFVFDIIFDKGLNSLLFYINLNQYNSENNSQIHIFNDYFLRAFLLQNLLYMPSYSHINFYILNTFTNFGNLSSRPEFDASLEWFFINIDRNIATYCYLSSKFMQILNIIGNYFTTSYVSDFNEEMNSDVYNDYHCTIVINLSSKANVHESNSTVANVNLIVPINFPEKDLKFTIADITKSKNKISDLDINVLQESLNCTTNEEMLQKIEEFCQMLQTIQ